MAIDSVLYFFDAWSMFPDDNQGAMPKFKSRGYNGHAVWEFSSTVSQRIHVRGRLPKTFTLGAQIEVIPSFACPAGSSDTVRGESQFARWEVDVTDLDGFNWSSELQTTPTISDVDGMMDQAGRVHGSGFIDGLEPGESFGLRWERNPSQDTAGVIQLKHILLVER